MVGLLEVVGRLVRAFGRENELGRGAVDILDRPGSYSIDKARTLLGFEPRVDLETGMQKTAAWLRREGIA